MKELRSALATKGPQSFEGYGDLSLAELLGALLPRYSETEMLIAAPSFPDQAAEAVARWLRKQFARMDGSGKYDIIRHLTIVSDLSEVSSPLASQWLKDNPFGGRLTLVDYLQKDTVILLPDIAITGPVNMRYGYNFTAKATQQQEDIDALWQEYGIPKEKASEETVATVPEIAENPAEYARDNAGILPKPAEDTAYTPVDRTGGVTDHAEAKEEDGIHTEAVADNLKETGVGPDHAEAKEEDSPKKEMPGGKAGQEEEA